MVQIEELLPNLSRLKLGGDTGMLPDLSALRPAVTGSPEDEELREALRLSYGVSDTFRLLFLGGGPEADALRRRRYAACSVAIAGNHPGADIQGNWEAPNFWARVRAFRPTAIVVDYGSDSWLSAPAVEQLAAAVRDLDAMLLFSPWRAIDGQADPTAPLLSARFNAARFSGDDVLFTFWSRLPESPMWPSEIVRQVTTKWGAQEMSAAERKQEFAALEALQNYASFDDAVAAQIELFSGCGQGV